MLTIIVGSDSVTRKATLEKILTPLRERGAEITVLDDVSFDADTLSMLAGSASLFGTPIVGVISNVADTVERREMLERSFPILIESEHPFIISEPVLPATSLKKAKGAEVLVLEKKPITKKNTSGDNFALTDAFSERSRARTWALYRKAIAFGRDPREISGMLFWAIKTMILAQRASSATEAGLHPFVYGKAKTNSKRFEEGELSMYASDLTVSLHEGLAESRDSEIELERFILRSL